MSMIVAEISSSIGLLSSVGGEETLNWGKLILSSEEELASIISTKNIRKQIEKALAKEAKEVKEVKELKEANETKVVKDTNESQNKIETTTKEIKENKNKNEPRVISIVV